MPLFINLRHLEEDGLKLQGALPAAELDLDLRDDLVRAESPLQYDLEVQKLSAEILVQGRLRLPLQCLCVRCLKPFEFPLNLERWTQLLPLTGEEQVSVVNECVDLTPFIREDILLGFPQHPLCGVGCRGLPAPVAGKPKKPGDAGPLKGKASAWTALDKLKLNN